MDYMDRIEVLQVCVIGETTSVVSCYKLVAAVRWLAAWATTIFWKWMEKNALLHVSLGG